MELNERIAKLSPLQRKLFEMKLAQQQVDILKIPITKQKRNNNREEQRFPLTSGQKRLWFIHQLEPAAAAYNITKAVTLKGPLDKQVLEQSINEMVRRHEILRTIFIIDGEGPVQVIRPEITHSMQTIDLKHLTGEKQEQTARQMIREESLYIFDLAAGPLLRTLLIEISQDSYIFLLNLHHIISDAVSSRVFIRELVQLYEAFSRGQPSPLPTLSIQYADYATWQQLWYGESGENAIKTEYSKKQESYWLEQFRGEIPQLNLPFDNPRPALQSFAGKTVVFHISPEETGVMKTLVLKKNVTIYMVLLALYNIFLAKLSGAGDIVVGTPVAGRRHPAVQNLIGMLVNTLALRNYPQHDKTWNHFLGQVKDNTLKAFENQEYRYENLLEKVAVPRETGRNPLFDVMFILKNIWVDLEEIKTRGITVKTLEHENETAKFDLTLTAWEAETLYFSMEYCTKLFTDNTIDRYIGYFKQVVHAVVESEVRNLEIKIAEIDILPENERRQILFEFNDTRLEYPHEKTIHELFAEQAKQTPNHIALVGAHETHPKNYNKSHMSYNQLNKRSNQLAYLLKQKGVKPETIVAIMMKRSLEMIVGILGILKAGGAYLPIDPEYPEERKQYMLADSGTKILLSEGRHPDIPSSHLPIFPSSLSSNLAYVIYTSGSTGSPKGVAIKHQNVVNFMAGIVREIDISPGKAILVLTTICFDIFVLETLVPLLRGMKLVIARENQQKDPQLLGNLILKSKVRILQLTPSRLKLLLDTQEGTRYWQGINQLIIGGEAFPVNLYKMVKQVYRGKIYNMYGPTETTIYSTVKALTHREKITIGKPIANTSIYILDRSRNLQPIGIPGELCIGGQGVGRGYLNRPQLTAEKFDHDIWHNQDDHSRYHRSNRSHKSYIPYLSYYRTGDLARWQTNGEIEFLGRIDHQIKIRGFRIEPGEIENQLLRHQDIKEALVLVKGHEKTDKYLCAYIVTSRELTPQELRRYLAARLPEYMIPTYFARMEKIPLTPNGKIDRGALPEPGIEHGQEERYIPPQNQKEEILAGIWARVLGIPKENIGIDSHFFQIGGHSLKAAVMATKIHKELNVRLPLGELFKTPTIRGLARSIAGIKEDKYIPIQPVEKKVYYMLSSAQKRLYILQQMETDNISYNLPNVIAIEGEIDKRKMEEIFTKLVNRHESLRTSFETIAGEPVQKIHEKVAPFGQVLNAFGDLSPKSQEPGAKSFIHSFIRPFDLSQAPLLRVGLLHTAPFEKPGNKCVILVDMHHIISDQTSNQILAREFTALTAAKELPRIRLMYKDYTEWRRKNKQKQALEKQETYWKKLYPAEIPVLNLPTDYPRPAHRDYAGHRVKFEIRSKETRALKKIAIKEGVTSYMLMLAIFFILLSKLSGQDDIIVGTDVQGRPHENLEQVIGMFVNTLALRNYPHREKTFKEFLKQIKEHTLEAYQNQDYPFDDLVEKLGNQRDASRNPLFDVMFALQTPDPISENGTTGKIPHHTFIPNQLETGTSKFDLLWVGVETRDRILFTVEYCKKLYKEETINNFIRYYKEIIDTVIKAEDIKLKNIHITHDLLAAAAKVSAIEFNF